jgi:hypothetical protein
MAMARGGASSLLLSALVATATLGWSVASAAEGIALDSREYKLMLEPQRFAGSAPAQAVGRFVREQLEPAARRTLDGKAADELREKSLDLDERRRVRFWDTASCTLSGSGFALRERLDLTRDGRPAAEPEITLKFRSADLFLAANLRLKARVGANGVESKLEEDVGALAVRTAAGGAVVALPRSSRSQFARSTTQRLERDDILRSLKDADRLFPTLDDDLRLMGAGSDMAAALTPSPEYRELVYESSMIDLAPDTKIRFALTIWYQEATNFSRPALAELSFSYATTDGAVSSEAARRGRELFLGLQDLQWADPGSPTKTALVACPG